MFDIKQIFLFNGLSESEKDLIISEFSQPVTFKKNDLIYSTDKFSKAIGFIVNGVAFAVTNNQNRIHLKTFESGMCFGAAAIFGEKGTYVSTVTAKTDVEILFITEQQLENIFKSYPQTAINYISFLSDKVRFLNTKLSVISCSGAEDTVLKYLTVATDKSGYARLPQSMTMLAKTLGLGRATLYRALDTLEAGGKILRENNKIKVMENEKNN